MPVNSGSVGIPEPKVRILLVDDTASNLLTLQAILESPDFELVAARSGEESLRQCAQGEFAVILMDVLMPGMNGRELAHELRIQRPDMKVLYVSGFADRAFEENDLSGPDVFMEKPYEFDELARKIREML